MKKIICLSILMCFFFSAMELFSQTSFEDEISIRVAKYRGDRKCAISYTFDDGLKEHYTIVASQLEKYGFRGTFWINGAKVNNEDSMKKDTTRVNWSELKEMSKHGHEISNHGWSHKKLTRLSLEEAREEILKNDSVIFAEVGTRPATFCYPYNARNEQVLELASMNRVSTRTQQVAIGKNSTKEKLDSWINTLLKEQEWGIAMTHGINYGYDAFSDPTILWNHLENVKSMEDSIWIGTFREIAAYIKERVHLELNIAKMKNGNLTVTPKLKLDKTLFSEPLTMVLKKNGITKVTITQDKKKIPIQISQNKIIFDFNPHGGAIQISYQ